MNIPSILHFFYMGGYGYYVFGSYSLVLILLAAQWFLPWRRFNQYKKESNESHS